MWAYITIIQEMILRFLECGLGHVNLVQELLQYKSVKSIIGYFRVSKMFDNLNVIEELI